MWFVRTPVVLSITSRRAKVFCARATTAPLGWMAGLAIPKAPARAGWMSYRSKSAMTMRFGSSSKISAPARKKKFLWHEGAQGLAGSTHRLPANRALCALRKHSRRGALALRLGQHAGVHAGRPIHHRPFPVAGLQSQFAD